MPLFEHSQCNVLEILRPNPAPGRQPPERFRVTGALEFVAALHARGVVCYIASGTDETAVRDEVALLGLAPLIADLRGAREDGSDAKRVVIDLLTTKHRLLTGELVMFGDGPAEIESARAASGLAIGVASTEDERAGIDARKRSLTTEECQQYLHMDACPSAP